MEVTGRYIKDDMNYETGKYEITFEVNETEALKHGVNEIAGIEKLSISAKKYRKKRSLDANALLWKCLGEMAEAIKTDKWQVYLEMLKRYGKFTHIVVKEKAVDEVKKQWRECEVVGEVEVDGENGTQKAVQMLCYFGSSTYNTKEFSNLLDGVKSEMVDMGLEPPLSEDMRRALEMWGA